MKKMILGFQISLDGFIEDRNGGLNWISDWQYDFDLMPQVDMCVLGGKMYPGYEEYWNFKYNNPDKQIPDFNRKAIEGEIEYAKFAVETQHVVLSTTLERTVWEKTRIVRDVAEIANLKNQKGKDIYVVGGASLASSLMENGLIDEMRLLVHPIVLGDGKSFLGNISGSKRLRLADQKIVHDGRLALTYAVV